ncbi:hypothetical protein D3C72_2382870 [compost metagenome]
MILAGLLGAVFFNVIDKVAEQCLYFPPLFACVVDMSCTRIDLCSSIIDCPGLGKGSGDEEEVTGFCFKHVH